MRNIDLSICSTIGVFVILVSFTCFCEAGVAKTETALKCHTCDGITCQNFNKKAEPQECTVDKLIGDNIGPSRLSNLSYINFRPIDMPVPLFSCQKLEAYDSKGKFEVRKCQLRLSGNQSCTMFYNNVILDKTYQNVSCAMCETDGCNSSGLIYIWIPLLFSSILFCFTMK